MTWVLQVILPCLPPPRPRTEDCRLYGRSVSQSISSLSVSSSCDKFYQPNTSCTKSCNVVFHCGMFDVRVYEQYMHHKNTFPARIGKGWLLSFIVSMHRFWLVIQSALLPLWQLSSLLLKSSLWYPEWWDVHSPPKKDCLHIQMILWHSWPEKSL